ncbi:dnaJ-like chaperone Jem1p [[Candida] anglica]|uniref:DnaJ-like chaperone Jem1p n=1 Tax=[Candida] anglica TaxID=148631 RepID=A0ABP0ELQ0_9ASCO
MKHIYVLAVQVLVLINIVIASDGGLLSKIQQANSLLSTEGPTINVLQFYEDLIREIEVDTDNTITSQLPQIYLKRAIISISLNKINSAISDLKICLKLDPKMKPAKKRLVDLLMERGDFDQVSNVIKGTPILPEDQETYNQIEQFKDSYGKAQEFYKQKDYKQCSSILEEQVFIISPSNLDSYKLHIECLKLKLQMENDNDDNDSFRNIIKSMSHILKKSTSPMQNLMIYDRLSSYLLFTQVQFDLSWTYVKNCLRIDNEYKSCGDLSKFYFKFQDLLKLLERYSIMNGHYYMETETAGSIDPEIILDEKDYKFINKFLFEDELKVSKLDKKKLPYSINNNFEYLKYKANNFGKDEQLPYVSFLDDLQELACESYIQIKDYGKSSNKICSEIKESSSNPFFPLHVQQVDKLLKKKNFHEAKRLLERFNKNVRHSKLFELRSKKIAEYEQRQQHQQQQQRFRQQQHQQRQYQHQQQQQQQNNNINHDIDYYKVLDVAKDADERTIKKAHRTQTLKYHPDKYKGNDLTPEQIENKMQEINLAYEVLSKKESREEYDRGGGQQQHHFGGGGQQGFNFGGFGGGGGHDFFSQFMHGGMKFG